MPVASGARVPSHPKVKADKIPAGRFAVSTHRGPYDTIVTTTAAFLEHAEESGLALQVVERNGATHWAGRVEYYRVGPTQDPNPENWRTDIEILLSVDES